MLRTICCCMLIALALVTSGCISVKTEGPAPTGYARDNAEQPVVIKAGLQFDIGADF